MNKQIWKLALVRTLPVMTGYLVLGLGFGILAQQNGYGIWWGLAMSLFIYAGSMQYLLVGLLTGGASLLSTALATLMVNARHLFYGISMVDAYQNAGKKKPYMIFALTDETYSLVCKLDLPDGMNPHSYCFAVSLLDQCYWVAGTCLGALVGQILPFDATGIDFAMTALFVTVFVEQWLSTKNHLPALVGLGLSAACLAVFGPDGFLIPAMLAITAALLLARRPLEQGGDSV